LADGGLGLAFGLVFTPDFTAALALAGPLVTAVLLLIGGRSLRIPGGSPFCYPGSSHMSEAELNDQPHGFHKCLVRRPSPDRFARAPSWPPARSPARCWGCQPAA